MTSYCGTVYTLLPKQVCASYTTCASCLESRGKTSSMSCRTHRCVNGRPCLGSRLQAATGCPTQRRVTKPDVMCCQCATYLVFLPTQALSQCDGFIRKLGATQGAVDDTATAAQRVSGLKLTDTAAICSSRAAQLYGLVILERGIQGECLTWYLLLQSSARTW